MTKGDEKMEEEVRFLRDTLNRIGTEQANVKQVFAFWQENIAQLDSSLILMMPKLVTKILESQDSKDKELTFRKLLTFGNLMQYFPQGNRENNFELAITSYQVCDSFFTPNGHPKWWAALQSSIGNVYWERTEGNRLQNIELAIGAYQSALKIYTYHEFPEEWAMAHFFLGHAYRCRMAGAHKENLEQAIDSYQRSLEVYTNQNFPVQWACTQNALGHAYRERIAGNHRKNIEKAVRAHQDALEVYTSHNLPEQWEVCRALNTVQTEREALNPFYNLMSVGLLFFIIFWAYLYLFVAQEKKVPSYINEVPFQMDKKLEFDTPKPIIIK
jgi:tetratricopeptide (TPR) repeat protein